MIKFAVCDDQPQMAQELSEHLTGYMEEKRIAAYSVDCFSSGSALLGSGGFDVIFLDIQMKHPDGMNSVETNSISCHLTTNPYIYKERSNADLHELGEVKESWPADNSFIVGVCAEKLYSENPDLYKALC